MTLRRQALVLLLAAAACGAEDLADAPASSALPSQPPGTDVWLASLETGPDGSVTVGEPTNITGRAGYDNQPHFLPDGSGFWFTATDDTEQADIWSYEISSGRVERITWSAPESEYSATPLPDGSGISVVRVEADSTQRIWRFDHDGANASVLLEDVAPVGYQAWADERTLVLFVLGSPATLQVADVVSGDARTVAEDVGRSIQPIPGSSHVSYVQRSEDGSSTIMRLDPAAGTSEPLIDAVAGGDFHAWTPSGTLLMGHEHKLFAWAPGSGADWTEVANFSGARITVSRLAVSPDGTQIAIVGEADFS